MIGNLPACGSTLLFLMGAFHAFHHVQSCRATLFKGGASVESPGSARFFGLHVSLASTAYICIVDGAGNASYLPAVGAFRLHLSLAVVTLVFFWRRHSLSVAATIARDQATCPLPASDVCSMFRSPLFIR